MATTNIPTFKVFDDLIAQGDFLNAALEIEQAPTTGTTVGWGTTEPMPAPYPDDVMEHPWPVPGGGIDALLQAQAVYKNPIKKAAGYKAMYGGGKKKSTEPPIELNLAAKPPSKYTKLATLEEYHAALKEGKVMAFLDYGSVDLDEYRQLLEPNIEYHEDSIKELMSKNGLWVHNAERVMLYGPALMFNKQVGIVTARNIHDWIHAEVRDHLVNRPYYVRVKSGWIL
jgi:hypothetical protein